MRKIPTLFVRDPDDMAHVLPKINPECEWVIGNEGTPTRKYDGTCIMIDEHGCVWARREVKPGKDFPDGFVPVEHDDNTGKTVGWEPAEQSSFAKYIIEAIGGTPNRDPLRVRIEPLRIWAEGTYELIGPKINGDPEGNGDVGHLLIPHAEAYEEGDFFFPGDLSDEDAWKIMRHRMYNYSHEGIVWHHDDGVRMAKLKRKDFNFV